jgi:ferric-dicitrate binding protein FerR (iron transport regulator)
VISLTLNDGTIVWLNSESSLRYPVAFVGNQRRVEITGEAYFEVAKDETKKFIVESNGVSTEVLGTHFNVNTYQSEHDVKITLLEGAIKVRKGLITGILKPGQQAEVTDDIRVTSNVDMDAVMSWKNGFFHFANTSIPELMKQISRWYDIDIVYNSVITQRQFGGEISREASLSEVLKILNKSKVKCRLEDNKLIIE